MPANPYFSSTSLTVMVVQPDVHSFRGVLADMVADGEYVRALKLFRRVCIHGHLANRSEPVKKSLLRGLWNQIDGYVKASFTGDLKGRSELLMESCAHEDVFLTAVDMIESDATLQRDYDIAFGKCAHMIEIMCNKKGILTESWIVHIEETLA